MRPPASGPDSALTPARSKRRRSHGRECLTGAPGHLSGACVHSIPSIRPAVELSQAAQGVATAATSLHSPDAFTRCPAVRLSRCFESLKGEILGSTEMLERRDKIKRRLGWTEPA